MTDHNAPNVVDLQAKLRDQDRQIKTLERTSKNRKDAKHSAIKALIKGTIKTKLWRLVKFVSTEVELKRAAIKCLGLCGITGYDIDSKDPEEVAKVDEWCEEHSQIVSSQLNDHRSYVVSRIKDVCFEYLDKHPGEELPPTAEIEHIVARHTQSQEAIFVWWWDEVLEKATGNTIHWNEKLRYYETISASLVGNTPKMLNMTSSTEAFALICYEGNRTKWQKMHELKKENPKKKNIRIFKNEAEVKNPIPANHYAYTDEYPQLESKYTDSKAGQQKFGGWKKTGLDRFVQLRIMNAKARRTSGGRKLEDLTLVALRALMGITGKDYEEQRKIAGLAKPKKSVAAAAGIVGLMMDSDDEFAEV